MPRRQRRMPVLLCVCVLGLAGPVFAQPADRVEVDRRIDALLKARWETVLQEEAGKAGLTVSAGRLSGTADQKTRVYRAVLDRLDDVAELRALITQEYVRSLVEERVESRMATSVNAASTNPATAGLVERSGSTSLAALAADLSGLVSADRTAVSLNLSALAFVTLKDPELYSDLANYQRHDLARRFSGTVVFGAKIPEKEITGLSNLPDFDTLLDAFSWDVKVRVLGDKDPRSARWSPLTVVTGGLLTQRSAVLLSLVGVAARPGESAAEAQEDASIVASLLTANLQMHVARIKSRIARSPQVSVKAAGTHLTKEPGKNRYAFAALFDVGVGPSDVTANVQYAVTSDIAAGAGPLFQTKRWVVSGQITSHLAPGTIVRGRTLDWSAGATANLFQDRLSVPVPVRNTWQLFTRLEVPVRGGGRIPVSVIYSNDPNALTKETHVTGLIGFSYDFSALKQLFAPGS